MWLLWLFVALPIVEIALFIQVGGLIGVWATLGLVVLAASLAAAALGLAIDPDHRPGVVANMARTAEIAQLVTGFPLPDEAELAPTFRPGEKSA